MGPTPENRATIKICLSGAQSSGKTTLLNALRGDSFFRGRYSFLTEITRRVQEQGFTINEKGTDATQRAIMEEHSRRARSPYDAVIDRCSLDGVVYTHYLFNHGQVTEETLKYAQTIFLHTIYKYHYIFYTDPNIPLVDDGVRSVNKEFKDEIVTLFNEYIIVYVLPVIVLKGSVQERLDTLKEIICNDL